MYPEESVPAQPLTLYSLHEYSEGLSEGHSEQSFQTYPEVCVTIKGLPISALPVIDPSLEEGQRHR